MYNMVIDQRVDSKKIFKKKKEEEEFFINLMKNSNGKGKVIITKI